MSAVHQPVEHLIEAVKRLSPEDFAEFTWRLTEWQDALDGGHSEPYLIEQATLAMPAPEQGRLRELARRSERGDLNSNQLQEYRRLARKAERISALRLQALIELARRREQPLETVKREIGWQGAFDEA